MERFGWSKWGFPGISYIDGMLCRWKETYVLPARYQFHYGPRKWAAWILLGPIVPHVWTMRLFWRTWVWMMLAMWAHGKIQGYFIDSALLFAFQSPAFCVAMVLAWFLPSAHDSEYPNCQWMDYSHTRWLLVLDVSRGSTVSTLRGANKQVTYVPSEAMLDVCLVTKMFRRRPRVYRDVAPLDLPSIDFMVPRCCCQLFFLALWCLKSASVWVGTPYSLG